MAERIVDSLHRAGFAIERRGRHQPIFSTTEAKLVHALGYEQCADAYLTEIGARPEQATPTAATSSVCCMTLV
ncbi:hypothetical protein [Mycobacterium sp.]|uniref:hypothetical protein n=1 Tax=Mycobacterium sp. TaxID=1785 RepID=UPI00260081DC|nr:hypothetical protein [Mycobacterium sp.]